jgi:hypothetical protein
VTGATTFINSVLVRAVMFSLRYKMLQDWNVLEAAGSWKVYTVQEKGDELPKISHQPVVVHKSFCKIIYEARGSIHCHSDVLCTSEGRSINSDIDNLNILLA